MSINCDSCNKDVTPDSESFDESEFSDYRIVDLNGKFCLCTECYEALSRFVRSLNFKPVVEAYKKEMKEMEE